MRLAVVLLSVCRSRSKGTNNTCCQIFFYYLHYFDWIDPDYDYVGFQWCGYIRLYRVLWYLQIDSAG